MRFFRKNHSLPITPPAYNTFFWNDFARVLKVGHSPNSAWLTVVATGKDLTLLEKLSPYFQDILVSNIHHDADALSKLSPLSRPNRGLELVKVEKRQFLRSKDKAVFSEETWEKLLRILNLKAPVDRNDAKITVIGNYKSVTNEALEYIDRCLTEQISRDCDRMGKIHLVKPNGRSMPLQKTAPN